MTDIVERLRNRAKGWPDDYWMDRWMDEDAAAEIERLRAAAVWHCEACGTVTRSGDCDCTKLQTGTQRLVPYDYRTCLNAEIERLRAALRHMIEISTRNSEAALMLIAIRMCAEKALEGK